MQLFLIVLLIILLLVVLLIGGILLDIYCGIKVRNSDRPRRALSRGMNRLRYFTEGRELFKDMKKAIEGAKDHIHLSFFIFEADETGSEWLELLKKKAREGIEVRLLVDMLGGLSLYKKKSELLKAGVQLNFSGKIKFPFTFYYLNRRNHRKIAVIDGRIGYFGGFNVSRDYIGNKVEKGAWHDNHLKVEGESVRELQHLFLDDWREAAGPCPDRPAFYPSTDQGPSQLALIGTDGQQIEELFAKTLAAARDSIIIGSPYFIPSRKLMNVLMDRLKNGVTLTILLPMKKDHALVKPASFLYLQPLVENGARLLHFYQGFYHSKVFVVDRRLAYVGTTNFDQRSFFWNDELSGFVTDPELVETILLQLEKEIHNQSIEISTEAIRGRTPLEKLKSVCSGWFSYFL